MISLQFNVRKIDYYLVATIVPIAACCLLILLFAVNMPLLDQWEIAPMLKHIKEGHFYWNDFWMQHNEHRILIPNIILVSFALLTGWNLIVECLLSLIVAIISFYFLIKIIQRVAASLKQKVPNYLPVLVSFIWFSAVQLENWLWGWQLEWFLNVLGLILVVYTLVYIENGKLVRRDYLLLIGGALLAQLSLGNGTLIWFIILAGLIANQVSWKHIVIPMSVGCLSTAAYYYQYVSPSHPSKTIFLHQPVQFIKYISIYLGRPVTSLRSGALVVGFLLIAAFIGLHVLLYMKHRQKLKLLFPIFLLGWYAIGSASITGISRVGFGLLQAYSSRYVTIAMLLLISVLVVVIIGNFAHLYIPIRHSKIVRMTSLGFLGLLLGLNYAWGLHGSIIWRSNLYAIKECTNAESPTDECLLKTYPNADIVRERLEFIKQNHLGGY